MLLQRDMGTMHNAIISDNVDLNVHVVVNANVSRICSGCVAC